MMETLETNYTDPDEICRDFEQQISAAVRRNMTMARISDGNRDVNLGLEFDPFDVQIFVPDGAHSLPLFLQGSIEESFHHIEWLAWQRLGTLGHEETADGMRTFATLEVFDAMGGDF